MENWDNLRFLLALHRHRTMSAAATALGTNVATVSRRLDRVAEQIGVPLFVKDQAGWTATEAAQPFLRLAEDFDARLTADRNGRAATAGAIAARIQVAAPPVVHAHVLLPRLARLLAAHPRMMLDLRNRTDAVGLGDADILLREGRPEQGRVIARRIAVMTWRGYVSTLAERRLPGWVDVDHRIPTSAQTLLGRQVMQTDPTLDVSLFDHKLAAMRITGLVGFLPDEIARTLPDMQPLDPAAATARSELWMVYHATRRDDPAIRAVTDWIGDSFRAVWIGAPVGGPDSAPDGAPDGALADLAGQA